MIVDFIFVLQLKIRKNRNKTIHLEPMLFHVKKHSVMADCQTFIIVQFIIVTFIVDVLSFFKTQYLSAIMYIIQVLNIV